MPRAKRNVNTAAALEAVKRLPENWRSREFSNQRANWLKERLVSKPYMSHTEAKDLLQTEFGVGIGFTKFTEVVAEVKRSLERSARKAERNGNGLAPSPRATAVIRPLPQLEGTDEGRAREAAKAVMKIMPNMTNFSMQVRPDGSLAVEWSVRSTSSMEIREE